MLTFTAADVGTKEAATADRAARARELRSQGWLYKDIASEIGVTPFTVRVYCQSANPVVGELKVAKKSKSPARRKK